MKPVEKVAGVVSEVLCSPWCMLAFTVVSLVSLPQVIASHNVIIGVGWLSGSCIQLVALPVLAFTGGRQSDRIEKTVAVMLADIVELLNEMHRVLKDLGDKEEP